MNVTAASLNINRVVLKNLQLGQTPAAPGFGPDPTRRRAIGKGGDPRRARRPIHRVK